MSGRFIYAGFYKRTDNQQFINDFFGKVHGICYIPGDQA